MRHVSLLSLVAVTFLSGAVFAQSELKPSLEVTRLEWKSFKRENRSVAMPQFPHQDYATLGRTPPTPDYQRTGPNGEWRQTQESRERNPKNVRPGYDETVAFELELKVRNTGDREIRSFEADIVFSDRKGDEIVRYRVESGKSLAPGKEFSIDKVVTGRERKEYSKPLDWKEVSDLRDRTTQRTVRFASITYADGSVDKFN